MTGVAIIGCGFVADYYAKTLPNHPELALQGVWDRDADRARSFAEFHSTEAYSGLDALLGDGKVELIINLTNPRSHFEVSDVCLRAGKHVYSEKPLAMDYENAKALVDYAEAQDLLLASAPCSLLGEQAQTIWKMLRDGEIGPVRHVRARLDEGFTHQKEYRGWRSPSGRLWPWKDEFEVGCTFEHAGYYLTWLTAFFGPAKSVCAASACLVPDKKTDIPLEVQSPDFSHAVIEFHSGMVATLVCSIVAPDDCGLTIVGEGGLIETDHCWFYGGPVHLTKKTGWHEFFDRTPLAKRLLRRLPGGSKSLKVRRRNVELVRPAEFEHFVSAGQEMDFSRGPAEMAAALREGRPCRLSSRFALHVNELAVTMQYPEKMGCPRLLESSFEPIEPMPWAR